MLVIDLAQTTWKDELTEASNVSIASISAYYRNSIGDLNNILGTCFRLNTVQGTTNYLEIVDGQNDNCLINKEAASIYKYVYLLNYYTRMIRTFTGVGDINLLIAANSDNGSSLRFTDRAGLAKLYIQLRKDTEETLKNLTNKYKMRNQLAQQTIGDDIIVLPRLGGNTPQPGVLYGQDIY